jgi:hypothetical protein
VALLDLLVEQVEEAFCVRLLDRPAVSARKESTNEALGIFTGMLTDDFDSDILGSRKAAAASASESESASLSR